MHHVKVNLSTPGESQSQFSNLSCSIEEKEHGASLYLIPDLTKHFRLL